MRGELPFWSPHATTSVLLVSSISAVSDTAEMPKHVNYLEKLTQSFDFINVQIFLFSAFLFNTSAYSALSQSAKISLVIFGVLDLYFTVVLRLNYFCWIMLTEVPFYNPYCMQVSFEILWKVLTISLSFMLGTNGSSPLPANMPLRHMCKLSSLYMVKSSWLVLRRADNDKIIERWGTSEMPGKW